MAQKAYDALKYVLTHTPFLHPPDYHRDYFLHLAVSDATIGMVLVQEDKLNEENVIYYLSRNLTKTKEKYAHVEKLALAVVQAIQNFRRYILFVQNYSNFRLQPRRFAFLPEN